MGSVLSRTEFHDDSSKRSTKAQLKERNKQVYFGENTVNQVACLLGPLSREKSHETYHLNLKLECSFMSEPVVGLAVREFNATNPVAIKGNPNFYLWYITKGKVEFRGKVEELGSSIPTAKSGDELLISFVMATNRVTLAVSNCERQSSHEITLPNLPNKLYPFVGEVDGGGSPTSFLIIESSTTEHNNNALIDMTYKIMFTITYGVINAEHNLKRVTRKSAQQGNGCALLPIKMSTGIHHWSFIVRCDFGASLCLGLARYPFKLSEEYIKDHLKHIYRHPGLILYRSYRGLLYRDGKQQDQSLDALGWQHGSSVVMEFIFDASKGTLEVIRNGRSMGTAFENLNGIFQPVVCYYAAYEKEVEFKQYLTSESSLDFVTSPPSSLESNTTSSSSSAVNADTICFDDYHIRGKIQLTADKKTVYRDKVQSGNSFCFLNIRCEKLGQYRFSFVVEHDQGASTCLGVTQATTPAKVKLNDVGNVYTSESLYLYRSFQGMLYVQGREQSSKLEEFWMSGSLVEMEVNVASNESSVRFKVNAMDQGIAFSGLQPPLTPLVAFYAGMEKRVTILHYEFVPVTQVISPVEKSLQQLQLKTNELGPNDIQTTLTHASKPLLPILASSADAAAYYPSCMSCQNQNDIIALPCKHSTVCSKHLSVGLNAPTRRCMVCDQKIAQTWNILLTKS